MITEEDNLLPVLGSAAFRNWLNRFLLDSTATPVLLPWVARLSPADRQDLNRDLAYIMAEPEEFDEPLDVRELREILFEFAETTGWSGPLIVGPIPTGEAIFSIDVRPQDLRTLDKAADGVRRAVEDLMAGFLAECPTDHARIGRFKIKKLADRDIRQIDLPDDYRLRYMVDEEQRTVYVVYLGPHPRGQADGRERYVRAAIHRRRISR